MTPPDCAVGLVTPPEDVLAEDVSASPIVNVRECPSRGSPNRVMVRADRHGRLQANDADHDKMAETATAVLRSESPAAAKPQEEQRSLTVSNLSGRN